MGWKRINHYQDERFSQTALNQHGCFTFGDDRFEVEIISDFEAVVRGTNRSLFAAVIDEFRFYAQHITTFYDENHNVVKQLDREIVFDVALTQIQPSQFYVDQRKVEAIREFIRYSGDVVIPVIPWQGRYLSLDGHTRLYCAVQKRFEKVSAILADTDEYIYDFAKEAVRRKIMTPHDLILLNHADYNVLWNGYCERYFTERLRKREQNEIT